LPDRPFQAQHHAMAAAQPPDDERQLFAVPPSSFVAARNALARRLAQAGDTARAQSIAALRKPSSSLWAVNQLAHKEPAELQGLLEAARALRRTEVEALRGGAGESYLRAGRDERAAVTRLTERAAALLEAQGLAAPPSVTRRIATTLHAAATSASAEVRTQLERGTLPSELDTATGFPTDGDAAPIEVHRSPPSSKAAERAARDARAAAERAAQDAEAAAQKLAQKEEEATAVESRAAQLREEAAAARVALETAQRRADQLAAAAAEAERAVKNPTL
jgi:hypothetical protein